MKNIQFKDLKGKTIEKIIGDIGDECVEFFLTNDERYRLIYHQDCCADCSIEDICGDLDDLIGSPILLSEEIESNNEQKKDNDESYTWVFYKLATIKGSVTIRWYGSSNGYYSEMATFEKLITKDEKKIWISQEWEIE